jgi:hypothetical protein
MRKPQSPDALTLTLRWVPRRVAGGGCGSSNTNGATRNVDDVAGSSQRGALVTGTPIAPPAFGSVTTIASGAGAEPLAGCESGPHQLRHHKLSSAASPGRNERRALVPPWLGRHGQPGVVGEQGDDGVDVARLDGVGETAG